MIRSFDLSRRGLLAAGVSVAFYAGAARAEAGDNKKLVVFIQRGGADGLSVSPPIGDSNYAFLRGEIAIPVADALKLDNDFALHPKLTAIHALAMKGEARIAPAVAIPNNQRSHFEAQDVLESGVPQVYGSTSGWLNRTLAAMAGRKVEGMSIGPQAPLILRGPIQAASWSPGPVNRGDRLPMILSDLYQHDAVLSRAFASGLETEAMAATATAATMTGAGPARPAAAAAAQGAAANVQAKQLGGQIAGFMVQPNGPQIVAVSIDGWDTHANQGATEGTLAGRLAYLDAVVDGLSTGLGAEWKNTLCVSVTEFGRTAKVNGTRGTDHGTGSTALVMGGALKRGGILGDWPGLANNKLFEGRDLASSMDVRSLFKGVLADHLGIDKRQLDSAVFPDSAAIKPLASIV